MAPPAGTLASIWQMSTVDAATRVGVVIEVADATIQAASRAAQVNLLQRRPLTLIICVFQLSSGRRTRRPGWALPRY